MHAAGKYEVTVKDPSEPWHLWGLFDLHVGNRGCHMEFLKWTIKQIRTDPHALWVGGGDYADLIGPKDERFDPRSLNPEMTKPEALAALGSTLKKVLAELFKPIHDKCIGLLEGNHEERYNRDYNQALVRDLCEENGYTFLGYSALADLVFISKKGKTKFRLVMHHGAGSAQTKGGKLNRLERFMNWFDGDIYLMGHVHTDTADRIVTLSADVECNHITDRTRVGAICGTFLRTYMEGDAGYGERRMYQPTPLGSPRITITPDKSIPVRVEL